MTRRITPPVRSWVRRAGALVIAVAAGLAVTCSPTTTDPEPVVYVAIGASDAVGVGAEDPSADAWPAVFRRLALSPSAEYHNLGEEGATTAEAIREQLPRALALRPTVATVWLNVNDLLSGVPPWTYEDRLRRLLTELVDGGRTRVLVANTPALEDLAAYRACLPWVIDEAVECVDPRLAFAIPPLVRLAVDAYNDAIENAAVAAGATVVDLHALGVLLVERPGLVSEDGFHPSSSGYRVVAGAFAEALHDSDRAT